MAQRFPVSALVNSLFRYCADVGRISHSENTRVALWIDSTNQHTNSRDSGARTSRSVRKLVHWHRCCGTMWNSPLSCRSTCQQHLEYTSCVQIEMTIKALCLLKYFLLHVILFVQLITSLWVVDTSKAEVANSNHQANIIFQMLYGSPRIAANRQCYNIQFD